MNELQIVEHNGIRVVTTKQVAEAYGTTSKDISYNFRYNKDRYTEGKHYFLLVGDDLKAFREFHELPKNLNRLYLWTERGALLLAKSINTDVAWEAYEKLVDFYFEKRLECSHVMDALKEPDRKPFRISTTPVPRNPNWFQRNYRRMGYICKAAGIGRSRLYHDILVYLGEEFNLDEARRIYQDELGEPPQYELDIVSYFPELAELADCILNQLEMEL